MLLFLLIVLRALKDCNDFYVQIATKDNEKKKINFSCFNIEIRKLIRTWMRVYFLKKDRKRI